MELSLLVINDVVDTLAYFALLFSVVEIYLMLNKLWSRKHIKEVSESISVSSRIVGLIPLSIFTLYYAINNQYQGVIEGMLWLFAGLVQLLIGIGIWVAGNKQRRVINLITRSIRKERSELGYLAKSIFKPQSQEKIIDLLCSISMIDGELDDKETEYIERLATKWNTKVFWGAVKARHKKAQISPFFNLWEDLDEYLKLNPEKGERKYLSNAVRELIEIDGTISKEEEIIIHEFEYLVDRNTPQQDAYISYKVVIVPQQEEQIKYLESHFHSLTKQELQGGQAFVTDWFLSRKFANKVKEEFQENGYFTTIIEPEEHV